MGLLPTLKNSNRYFPERKGLVTGIIASGFGFSSVLLNIVIYKIINPNNIKIENGFYPKEVYQNVKEYIFFCLILFTCFGIVGSLLTFPFKEEVRDEYLNISLNSSMISLKDQINQETNREIEKSDRQSNVKNISPLKSYILNKNILYFISLLLCMFTVSATYFNTFKFFAIRNKDYINESQTFIGIIILNTSNGLFRSGWGFLFDKFKFKTLISIAIAIQIIVSIEFYWTITILPIVYINLILIGCLNSCITVLFPSIVYRKYGTKYGSEVYSIIYIAYGLSTVIAPVISLGFDLPNTKSTLPYLYIYSFGGILGIFGYAILYFLDVTPEV